MDQAMFQATHIYSKAKEANTKRNIDVGIMAGDFANGGKIDMHDESYLRTLIDVVSLSKVKVQSNAKGLQFFIINGGGEGFLAPRYKGVDAGQIIIFGQRNTAGKPGSKVIMDDNDLLIVFDQRGKLINSALLRRPVLMSFADDPNFWTKKSSDVYFAWDGQPVGIYHNANYEIKYYGLWVYDKLGWYATHRVTIDMHKQEATNGCIFIVDPATPGMDNPQKLSAFEPQLIRDVQKAIGVPEQGNIGIMRMLEIYAGP